MKIHTKALALSVLLLTSTGFDSKESSESKNIKVEKVQPQVEVKQSKIPTIVKPQVDTIQSNKTKDVIALPSPEIEFNKKDEKEETKDEDLYNNEEVFEENTEDLEIVSVDNTKEADIDNVSSAGILVEPLSYIEEDEQIVYPIESYQEISSNTPDYEESGLTIVSPTEEEVKAYWKNYQSQASDQADFYGLNLINPESEEIFEDKPIVDLSDLNMGALSNNAQMDALHIVNTARFASGITNELIIADDKAQFAQAATMINRLNSESNHYPHVPQGLAINSQAYVDGAYGAQNSNLAASFNLLDSVLEYIKDDLGSENQLEVGHRRWVLNPQASLVGFGQTEDFNAMFVNNDDYAGQNADIVYAYPSEIAISEFHSDGSSLSLMFGENFDISNANVEVLDLATGDFTNQVNVDESFKGNVKAITFGYGMDYQAGTKLEVKVNGIRKNGVDYPINYTINYISIG